MAGASSFGTVAAGPSIFASLVPEHMPYSAVRREASPEAEMASRNNLFEQYIAQQQLQQHVQEQIQQSQGAYLHQRQQSENAALQLYLQQHMEYQTRQDANVRLSNKSSI